MTLKEKITQVIVDLNKESIKYPRMKTNDVTYMLAKLINDYNESDNNGWVKIESEEQIKYFQNEFCWVIMNNGEIDKIYIHSSNHTFILKNATHYQLIQKPQPPIF